jgi:hypothetical protein
MGISDDFFNAVAKNQLNYLAAGSGLGYSTLPEFEQARFACGGAFQGWYHGVLSFGGAPGPGPDYPFGPDRNGYTLFCSLLGSGYYVPGVAGTSTYNPGVYGQTENPSTLPDGLIAGVIGSGFAQPGVIGWSRMSNAVYAISYAGTAVRAESALGGGVTGVSGPQEPTATLLIAGGVVGTSDQRAGVIGTSNLHVGVVGFSNHVGVLGWTTNPASYAGYFAGNVLVDGNLTVLGAKSAAVPFPDGTHRGLYCMESPELWFEDFGTAKLKRGRAVVRLDADFAKVVTLDEYHVFATPDGDCRGLYVRRKTAKGFELRELGGGKSSVLFFYRIVARRKDIKPHRRFPKIDTRLPLPAAAAREPAPRAAGLRAFVGRLEREARKRAPKGAKRGKRRRPSTMLSRPEFEGLVHQTRSAQKP